MERVNHYIITKAKRHLFYRALKTPALLIERSAPELYLHFASAWSPLIRSYLCDKCSLRSLHCERERVVAWFCFQPPPLTFPFYVPCFCQPWLSQTGCGSACVFKPRIFFNGLENGYFCCGYWKLGVVNSRLINALMWSVCKKNVTTLVAGWDCGLWWFQTGPVFVIWINVLVLRYSYL